MVPTPPRCTLFPYTTLFRSSGISTGFPELSRSYRQVAHVLLTHPPLIPQTSIRRFQFVSCARLACIRHAASVRPEPRSNSPKKVCHINNGVVYMEFLASCLF